MKSIYSLQRPEVIQLRRRPFETLCVSSMQSALLVQCLVERFGLQVFWILLSSVVFLFIWYVKVCLRLRPSRSTLSVVLRSVQNLILVYASSVPMHCVHFDS